MNYFSRVVAGWLLTALVTVAQTVPDRFIVELSEEPLGAAVRTKGKSALAERHQAILSEQSRARAAVQANRGRVLTTVDSLMNALIVKLPSEDSAALATVPGVKRIYPVRKLKKALNRALALHSVPQAWTMVGGEDKAGAGVKIAILDTGITPTHPGFQDASLKLPAGFPAASSPKNLTLTNNKIIVARSYEDIYELDEPDDATDRDGHGTAVAMCAAGVRNTGPLATITGVAPKAWIGGYKIVPLNTGEAAEDVILKAMDDALADGMDIINLSFGSPFAFGTGPDLLPGVAFERLKSFGVMVFVAAGNDGPGSNTMGDFASQPSVIAVGSTRNDRTFTDSVIANGTTYRAFAGTGPTPAAAVKATVYDVTATDPTGFLCSPLGAGTATGKIALILRGVCTFEEKLNNAKAGGAVAALFYTDAPRPDAFTPSVGTATLPAVLVSYGDGVAIKAAVQQNPALVVELPFKQSAFSQDYRQTSAFSSRGPTYDFRIKPDLSATGGAIYTATQKIDDEGESYSSDGYILIDGTSFASPIAAGAAAVLKAARPGLTVDQYSSLLINGATPFFVDGGPLVERVQRTGAGMLNLATSLHNSATIYPTSLTFGVGTGVMAGALSGHLDQFAITNIGRTADTFKVKSIPYDSAPPLQFDSVSSSLQPQSEYTLTLNPGQTKTLYAFWTARLPRGEYQGQILVQGNNSATLTPYWYGAPTSIPRQVFELNPPGTTARASSTYLLYVRITDDAGLPVLTNAALRFSGTASTGATIDLLPDLAFPDLRVIRLRVASTSRTNTFTYSFGDVTPITHTITVP